MVSSKRLNTPLITVEAMVQVGPWLVRQVHHGHWRNCDRCDADHKEVWVCETEADEATVATHLDGKRVWRIGSTCGPKLMLLTDAVWGDGQSPSDFWDQKTKGLSKRVKLAVDATRALAGAKAMRLDSFYVPLILQRLEGLKQNLLTDREQSLLRRHTGAVMKQLRALEDAEAHARDAH